VIIIFICALFDIDVPFFVVDYYYYYYYYCDYSSGVRGYMMYASLKFNKFNSITRGNGNGNGVR
jgi:hypothetical protein